MLPRASLRRGGRGRQRGAGRQATTERVSGEGKAASGRREASRQASATAVCSAVAVFAACTAQAHSKAAARAAPGPDGELGRLYWPPAGRGGGARGRRKRTAGAGNLEGGRWAAAARIGRTRSPGPTWRALGHVVGGGGGGPASREGAGGVRGWAQAAAGLTTGRRSRGRSRQARSTSSKRSRSMQHSHGMHSEPASWLTWRRLHRTRHTAR